MNELIEKFCKAVSIETKDEIKVDDKYSDLVVYLIIELRKYKDSANSTEFFGKINAYIKKREFSPLIKTPEFKGLFEQPKRTEADSCDTVVSFMEKNMDKILKFSVLSNLVLSTNEIFTDERLYHYRRSCKVSAKLDNLNSQDMSSKTLVEIYANGGFDRLCPKELEDKRRCDELRINAAKIQKRKLGLGRIFYGV